MRLREVVRVSGDASLDSARIPQLIEGLVAHGDALDVATLAREHGDARVRAVPVVRGEVAIDERRGLVATETTLGEALEGIMSGDGSRYVMSALDELPPALRNRLDRTVPPRARGTRKLWVSAPGTVSTLHFDVQRNVHSVVSGAKRFLLYPPRASLRLYPRGLLDGVPNGAHVDPERPDLVRHPRFAGVEGWVTDVRTGESVLVPPGWWHHVRTLEPTVAVNTWWSIGLARGVAALADLYKRARGVSR